MKNKFFPNIIISLILGSFAVEYFIIALFLNNACSFGLSSWIIGMLSIFVVVFPILLLGYLVYISYLKLDQLRVNEAKDVNLMNNDEMKRNQITKAANYGLLTSLPEGKEDPISHQSKLIDITEAKIIRKYIEIPAIFARKRKSDDTAWLPFL